MPEPLHRLPDPTPATPEREPAFNSGKYDKFGFTNQQRDALHHYLTDCDLDPVRALVAAGYNETWAKANGPDFFSQPKFVNFLENHYSKEAVRAIGWQAFFRLVQGLSAVRKMKLGQGSGTKFPIETVDVPDWQTRIHALVQYFKVFGEYAPTKVNVEGDLLAGKTDEEKAYVIAEAERTLKRILGSAKTDDGDGDGDSESEDS